MSDWLGKRRVWIYSPEEPSRPVPALFTWELGEMPSLYMDLIPSERPEWLSRETWPRLFLSGAQNATLYDLIRTKVGVGPLKEEYSFCANRVLFDEHFELEPRFRKFHATVSGCTTWLETSGIMLEERVGVKMKFQFDPVSEEVWPIEGNWKVIHGMSAAVDIKNTPHRQLRIEEYHEIGVQSDQDTTLEDLVREFHKVLCYVEFATGNTIFVDRGWASRDGKRNGAAELGVAWKQDRVRPEEGVQWFFPFALVRENFGAHLKRWFELYSLFPLALDMYRTAKRHGVAAEFRFFSITSALESLHRSLFETDEPPKCEKCKRRLGMSLENRLLDLQKRYEEWFGDLLPQADCKRVADTRNYLAHQTQALKPKAIPDQELLTYYRRLNMVFEKCLLAQLPFSDRDRQTIIDYRWNLIRGGVLGDLGL